MRYYRMLDDLTGERWFIGEFKFKEGESVWNFVASGIKDSLSYIPKAEITHKGKAVNITFGDFDIFVVDEKARNCFSSEEVQFFSIQISHRDYSLKKYFIMTIINELACLDESLSEFDVYDKNDEIRPDLAGQYKTVYKMIVDKSKTNGLDIFRIKNYNVAVIVSENLKNKLEQHLITGVKFKEV